MNASSHNKLIKETIETFVEFVLAEQFTGVPDWVAVDRSISQLKAIFLMGHYGELTVGEVAKLLGMGNPATSILVQRLVEQHLVERSEDEVDRRRTLVRLTEKGLNLVSGRHEQREALLGRWLSQLEEDELAGLLKGLCALGEIARAERESRRPLVIAEDKDRNTEGL